MQYKITFFKEFGAQLFEKFFRLLIGLYLIKEISEYLGPEKYGSLIYIESNYLMLFGISMMGFDPLFTKIFAHSKDYKKYLFNGIILLTITSLIILFIFQSYLVFSNCR